MKVIETGGGADAFPSSAPPHLTGDALAFWLRVVEGERARRASGLTSWLTSQDVAAVELAAIGYAAWRRAVDALEEGVAQARGRARRETAEAGGSDEEIEAAERRAAGMTVDTRRGVEPHPLVVAELRQRSAYQVSLTRLGLIPGRRPGQRAEADAAPATESAQRWAARLDRVV